MFQSLVGVLFSLVLVRPASGQLYGCTNSLVTDYYRQVAYELHKQYRELVFTGDAPNKCGTLPTPLNYYNIEYNCDLEDSAATWATQCNASPSPESTKAVVGEWVAKSSTSGESVTDTLIQIFNESVLQAIVQTGIGSDATVKGEIGNWNDVASAGTYQVGCASIPCKSDPKVVLTVCQYQAVGTTSGQAYQVGDGCTSEKECTIVTGSTCSGGWCHAPSATPPLAMCEGSSMTDDARTQVLDRHNYYRSLVIQGKEVAGPDGTRTAPMGGNMYKLSYSCEIEAVAQAYADTCPHLTHSDREARNGWGENIAVMTAFGDISAALVKAVDLFYSELEEYGMIDLDTNIFTENDIKSGHYTQVCWAKTYEVGCGIKECEGNYNIVCEYNPTGNYLNNVVYPPGKPCTSDGECTVQPSDTCSTTDGLCIRGA